MSSDHKTDKNSYSPQYFIISKSEPKYDLLKKQLLDAARVPAGSSCYFIRAEQDQGCVCRIRAGNGTVLFYEILNHIQEGISEEDIQEVLSNPSNAAPLAGYYFLTPKIEEQLIGAPLKDAQGFSAGQKEPNPA